VGRVKEPSGGWTRASEHQHQVALFKWAVQASHVHPELRWLFAVPNAGKRTIGAGRYMLAEGLRPGVPDICLPVPRAGYAALFIELKSDRGTVSESQKEWLAGLTAAGNFAKVCYGWDEARETIVWYLTQQALPGFGNTV
jgi:hypothetical protein